MQVIIVEVLGGPMDGMHWKVEYPDATDPGLLWYSSKKNAKVEYGYQIDAGDEVARYVMSRKCNQE